MSVLNELGGGLGGIVVGGAAAFTVALRVKIRQIEKQDRLHAERLAAEDAAHRKMIAEQWDGFVANMKSRRRY